MRRIWIITSLAVALALYALLVASFRSELIDDAYISLTYARHLANGDGLVWNPGERVEGYTDFLWVLLLSLSGATPSAAEWFGILAGALLLVALTLPIRLIPNARASLVLLPVLVAAHPAFAFWSAKGLETSLFTLFLTAGLFVCAYAPAVRWSVFGVHLLVIASLTRPDGLLFLALASADALRRHGWRHAGALVALPLALLVPHLAFRLAYYGYPLPNTYYVKVGASADQVLRGLHYVWRYLAHPGAILLAATLAFPRALKSPERFLTVALASGIAAVAAVGGDAFGAHRFIVPLMPTISLLAIAGLHRIADRVAPQSRIADSAASQSLGQGGTRTNGARRLGLLNALPLSLAALLAASMLAGTWRDVRAEETSIASFTKLMAEVGHLLKARTPEHITIALNPAGAVPYYSERKAIDMLGLNDAHIAHSPTVSMGSRKAGHEKGDGAYVLSRRPEMILIGNVWVDEADTIKMIHPSRRSEVQLVKNPALYELYEMLFFPLGDGRSLKALVLREGTSLPESGWGPKRFLPIPKEKWQ
ncbi:MAG: hypothetical protein ACKVU1_08260 [bacterium]